MMMRVNSSSWKMGWDAALRSHPGLDSDPKGRTDPIKTPMMCQKTRKRKCRQKCNTLTNPATHLYQGNAFGTHILPNPPPPHPTLGGG